MKRLLVLILLCAGCTDIAAAATKTDACPVITDNALAQIQAQVAKGSWNGHGKSYVVDTIGETIKVKSPSQVTDATISDVSPGSCKTRKGKTVHPEPVFTVGPTSDVAFDDLSISGTHRGGKLYYPAVSESGIRLNGTSDYTLDDVSADHLWGDGVDIQSSSGKDWHCAREGSIFDLSAWNDNRDGISPTCENGLTMIATSFGDEGQTSVDFEADFKGPHAENVTVSWMYADGIVMEEPGNVNVSLWDGQGTATAVKVYSKASNPTSDALDINFSGLGCGQVHDGCVYARGPQGDIDLHDVRISSGALSKKAPAQPIIEMYGGTALVDGVTISTSGKPWRGPVCGSNAHVFAWRSSFGGCA